MAGPPPSGGDPKTGRLRRCIRDLAALHALPSMCVGRGPKEALAIVLDALPTALGCDVLHLALPGPPPTGRAVVRGAPADDAKGEIGAVAAELEAAGAGPARVVVPGVGELWAITATFRADGGHGRLFLATAEPLDPETDVVLARVAANLVASTLETARVLDAAHRKDEFMAVLGHELRNPLAPILTAVELLAREPKIERERRVIERHTVHLVRLVDDLLDISRVTRGNVELRHEVVDLSAVLERAAEIAAPLVARHRHRLHVDRPVGAIVSGDAVRLAQVFGNLLNNAAKFTPAGGNITVKVTRAGDRVDVTVRDDGRGIARDQLDRIFEPFVQAERERDALSGGLGLGLAIVKDFVERHGGTIRVESEGAGRGSAFTVTLPATVATAAPRPEPPALQPGRRDGVRVLVVDDNEDVAALLSEALALEGFTTAVAHDAPGALALGRRFIPHAAVLDVGLPDVDGYQLAAALREEHGSGVTLIAATGYAQRRDRELAAGAGFACHFVKPVSVKDLVTALDAHVIARAP